MHRNHHSFTEKIQAGFRFAFTDVWGDLAVWFLFGLLLSGIITVMIPESVFSRYMGGGFGAMLIMLGVGIPIYICATASTPIAATLILQGVSPGAALVFLMTGPATNVTSLTVLTRVLGKRATGIYLATIAICAVGFGLLVDWIYKRHGHLGTGRGGAGRGSHTAFSGTGRCPPYPGPVGETGYGDSCAADLTKSGKAVASVATDNTSDSAPEPSAGRT